MSHPFDKLFFVQEVNYHHIDSGNTKVDEVLRNAMKCASSCNEFATAVAEACCNHTLNGLKLFDQREDHFEIAVI